MLPTLPRRLLRSVSRTSRRWQGRKLGLRVVSSSCCKGKDRQTTTSVTRRRGADKTRGSIKNGNLPYYHSRSIIKGCNDDKISLVLI
ncbi:hypothetical protein E2C01_064813 [Portunus trituberculatus]|uniref:Uncharacterized protein n=1 Tax=Portunus trituberculatus TaxID=210409 RepID=A0A5B7HCT8_PORTR|nr:hypothetical protein [Portunus trituberculatus]